MTTDTIMVHTVECKCLYWKPILAGALVAIGLTFLLNLFSVAIGLTAFTTGSDGVEKLALSGLVATSLGVIASMFAAGWITGYLGKHYCTKRHLGALYGFLTWCLALIITIFLASHAQEYITFYGHLISGTTNTVQVASSSAAGTVTTAAELPPKTLVISTYIIFILFFLSAFACSLGGHAGMRHRCKEVI
ncbi:MAG: hypothetical protein ACYCQI_08365 [Gammaproteobacteria bacterium]